MKKNLLLILTSLYLLAATATPGYMGIYTTNFAKENIQGVRISDVIANSAAEQFGLKENDIIIAVNNQPVTTSDMLVKAVTAHQVSEKIEITFVRNGITKTLSLALGEKPQAINYKITIDEKAEGTVYNFTDDKLSIVLNADGTTPKTVTQLLPNGTSVSWTAEKSTLNNLYAQFNGIQDKINALIKLKKQQGTCDCHCKNYTFPYYKIDKKNETVTVKAATTDSKVSVFPNPTSGKFTLDISTTEKSTALLTIIDVNGQVVRTQSLPAIDGKYSQTVDLYGQAKGVYIVQVKIGEQLHTQKVVLQ